jgi:TonB-linked SusC/RagA family outer membrane protein
VQTTGSITTALKNNCAKWNASGRKLNGCTPNWTRKKIRLNFNIKNMINQLFMKKHKILSALFIFAFTIGGFAQEMGVNGKVTSSDGESLIGATVTIKGQNKVATSTDVDGSYIITAQKGDVLVFSYIGFTAVERKVAANTINVVMEPSFEMLAEVVAVGYGVQKKADMTGSVSTIKGEALLKAPLPTLTNGLAGKLTGVISTQQSGRPGLDDPSFYIRGVSTFGDNGALMLVDGVERAIGRLNPNDIESITVLKDAASAAVYGARAANGVILVTTKRGLEGKTKISYSGTFGFQTPTVIPEMMNAYEYAKYLNLAKVNIGNLPVYTAAEIQAYKDGTLPSTNWWDETFKSNAGIQQHSLTVTGGGDKVKFFASLGYLDQGGLYDLSEFKNYNVRSNIDAKINNNLSVSLDLAGRQEEINRAYQGEVAFSTVIKSKPTEPAYVPDYVEKGGLNYNGIEGMSPIGQTDRSGYNISKNSFFQGTIQGVYAFPFLKGLKAKASFSYDRFFSTQKIFSTPYEYYQYDKGGDFYTKKTTSGGINLSDNFSQYQRITVQTALTYDATFNKAHNLSALLLFEESSYNSTSLGAERFNYLSAAIDQLFAGPDLDKTNRGSASETARKGYVGRVNYDYRSRYLFQFNFRYDGSYNFPNDKRWGFFPAVSAGWRLSEEPFLKDNPVFHNLKIRASYGEFGNDRVSAFQYLSGYQYALGAMIGNSFQSGITDTGISNPNITWETATNMDVGLDFSLLKGTISGEFTYFYKKTRDILLARNASVPATFGATLPSENIGKVDNYGVEIVLRYANKVGGFHYMVEGNLTYAKSKVVFMDEAVGVPDHQKRTGLPLSQYFGYKALGLFQSQEEINNWAVQDGQGNASLNVGDVKYEDYHPDGVINGDDTQLIGKSQIPEMIFGFNINLSYKNFDLTMNFQGAAGFSQFLRWDPFYQDQNALAIFKDSWSEDNTDARFPRLYSGTVANNRYGSSMWLYDPTYLRLKNLELAYTFEKEGFLRKLGIQALRVFVSGNNLLTFSKMKDFDPEAPTINPDNSAYYYPQLKTFNLGFNIEF